MKQLGKIQKVDLREIWQHEAQDFTKWLAKPENIALLSDELGIDMEVIQTEANIGNFTVDILAEESNTGHKIIIENQLETTDHDHLGKLITYAAGIEAKYVIWIFKNIRGEHRKALDWLNEITNDEVSFFGIRMELWKIGDSLPAPKFHVISSPNDWSKMIKKISRGQELTEDQSLKLKFWEGYKEYLQEKNPPFTIARPLPRHAYDVRIGSSEAHIAFMISIKKKLLRTVLYIRNNKELFHYLYEHKNEIENELGMTLNWEELPKAKASRIEIQKRKVNLKNPNTWPEAYEWLYETGVKFYKVFKKYINEYS